MEDLNLDIDGVNEAPKKRKTKENVEVNNEKRSQLADLDIQKIAKEFTRFSKDNRVVVITSPEKEALKIWFFRLHNILSPKIAEIEKIKYDGKLIILDDGSKYESDDENISDGWFDGDKVLVIYDEMYKLDDLERVGVEEDND